MAPDENGTAASRPALVVGYYYPSTTACSATVDLTDVADTYIQKDAQTTAAGSVTTMFTNPGNNDTGNNTNHSLVKFDLAPVPPGATSISATLKVTVTTNRNNNHTVNIHRMNTAWTEVGASWGDSNGLVLRRLGRRHVRLGRLCRRLTGLFQCGGEAAVPGRLEPPPTSGPRRRRREQLGEQRRDQPGLPHAGHRHR